MHVTFLLLSLIFLFGLVEWGFSELRENRLASLVKGDMNLFWLGSLFFLNPSFMVWIETGDDLCTCKMVKSIDIFQNLINKRNNDHRSIIDLIKRYYKGW